MQESAFIITMLVSITIVLIALLLMAVPVLITNWQLFAKAGKPGWASIVPVYNVVVMTQIAKKPEWMGWTVGIASFFTGFINLMSEMLSNQVLALGLGSLNFFINIGVIVLAIIIFVSFVHQYRHATSGSTTGFWLSYFFLPLIAVFLVKNIAYNDFTPSNAQYLSQPGQQPTPPYVPPVA